MPRKNNIPWLDYEGQDTAQILACKETHSILSLLCALEQGIQLRNERTPETANSPEEITLLAIRALQREVNNGGYHQFFLNSSRQYALTVVPALSNIGCDTTAALTQSALDALKLQATTLTSIRTEILREDLERDQNLDRLDKEFYRIYEIEDKLFSFVESRQHAFVLGRMSVAPRPPSRVNHNLIALGVGLQFATTPDLTFEAVRKLAAEIAIQKEIEPTASELNGAAYKFLFQSFLKAGEMERCEEFAGPAFDLTREDTGHCVTQKQWVEKLVAQANFVRADEVTLQYLEYLNGEDASEGMINGRINFWADVIRKHGAELPASRAFFREHFPQVSSTAASASRVGPERKVEEA
jgi:hypothetical protein